MRVTEHWDRLPREVVQSPSAENPQEAILCHVLWEERACLSGEVEAVTPWRPFLGSLPARPILGSGRGSAADSLPWFSVHLGSASAGQLLPCHE